MLTDQEQAMQALDRAKSAIEDAQDKVSEFPSDHADAPSLSQSELEHRLDSLIDQARELTSSPVGSLERAANELADELQSLYNDV